MGKRLIDYGIMSSSTDSAAEDETVILTKHNNNEGGTGNLIQNPLFCGQGRWTSYVLVINRLIPNSLLPVSIKKEKSSPSNSTLMPPPPPPTISAKSQQLKTSPTSPMMSPSSDTVKDMGRDQETKQNFNDLELIWKHNSETLISNHISIKKFCPILFQNSKEG